MAAENSNTKTVPVAACRFAAGDAKLGKESDGKTPVKIRARSSEPINHYYWGKVVHDMAGVQYAERIILDYCHDDKDVVGYGDTIKPSNDGLDVEGFLTSIAENDRADEIAKKAGKGVPWQASIFFQPLVLEEVMEGASVLVNGKQLSGPALIIRQWKLRGLAVCPYGYDQHTSSQLLSEGEQFTCPITTVSPETETQMSDKTTTPPAPQPSEAELKSKFAAETKAELKRYVDKFGASKGTEYFTAGKTWPEAIEAHCDEQQKQLTAKETEIAELKTKLAAAPKGEEKPLGSGTGDAGTKPTKLSGCFSLPK